MAFKHQGWLRKNANGVEEWKRLVQLCDGEKTPAGVCDILNHDYDAVRKPRTPNSVRKKAARMGIDLRKHADSEFNAFPVNTGLKPVHIHVHSSGANDDLYPGREVVALITNDYQVPYHDPAVVALVLTFADQYLHPDEIYVVGDFLDFYSISAYSKARDRRNQWRLWDELQDSKKVFNLIQEVSGVNRIRVFGGNHEDRLRRYLRDRAPELVGIPYLEIPELLGISERDFSPYGTRELHIRNNLLVTHGDIVRTHSGHTAKAMVEKYGMSVIHGHCHRGGTYYLRRYQDTVVGQENFCMCRMDAEYVAFPNWAHGFSVVTFDANGRRFHIEPVPISGGGFMYHGQSWRYSDIDPKFYLDFLGE